LVSATFIETGQPVSVDRIATLPTLSGLFELADNAYARNATAIRYTTNATLGYLESLFIDYSASIADEEIGYTVSAFGQDTA